MLQRIALFSLLIFCVFSSASAQESATPDYFRTNADKLLDSKVYLNVAYGSLSDQVRSDDMADVKLYCVDKRSGSYSYFDALLLKEDLKNFMKRIGTDYDTKSGELKTTKLSGILRKSSAGFLFLDVTDREPVAGSKHEPIRSLVIIIR